MSLDNFSVGELEKVILADNITGVTSDANFIFHPQAGIDAPVKLPNGWVEFYDSTQVNNLGYTWDNVRGAVLSATSSIPTPKYTSSQIWLKDGIRLVWAPEIVDAGKDVLHTIVNYQIKKWYRPVFAPYEGATTLSTAYGWWVEERQNFQILPYCQVSEEYELLNSLATVAVRAIDNGNGYPASQSQFAVWKSTRKISYIAYDPSIAPNAIASNWQSIYGILNSTKYPRWFKGAGAEVAYPTVEQLLQDNRPVLIQTYDLSASFTTINAGTTLTITLTTTNVSNDTKVPYAITGLTSTEISGSPLTSNFVVNSNSATLSITPVDTIPSTKTLVVSIVGRSENISITVNPALTPAASTIPGAATTSSALGTFKVGVGDNANSTAPADPTRLAALSAASAIADSNNFISKLRAAGAPTTTNPSVSGIPGQATLFKADTTVAIAGASGPGVTVSGGGSYTTTDIEFDYSPHLTNIATSLAIIATNTSTIAVNTTLMAANSTTIAEKVTAMETYQKRLKELGEGRGIHVVGPWEWVGMIAIYRLLVEEGKALDTSMDVTNEQMAQALSKVNEYLSKINQFPTNF